MVESFEEGRWYRWTGPKERPAGWNLTGRMDAMLDGVPRRCCKATKLHAAFEALEPGLSEQFVWNWIHGREHIEEVDIGKFRKTARRILDQATAAGYRPGGLEWNGWPCDGVLCDKNCPCHGMCGSGPGARCRQDRFEWLWKYCGGEDMNRTAALERLEAIEQEAKALRAIIERKHLAFHKGMNYVGLRGGCPHLMVGNEDTGYFFQDFDAGPCNNGTWKEAVSDPQEFLDQHIEDGFEITEFSDLGAALRFFQDHL